MARLLAANLAQPLRIVYRLNQAFAGVFPKPRSASLPDKMTTIRVYGFQT